MALNKIWNIKKLYPYNLAEGEGVGTSYEYVAKALALEKMWRNNVRPKSILIAGLPEIYGLSLDFLLWGKIFNCPVTVIEDRKEIIDKLNKCLQKMRESGLEIPAPEIRQVKNLEEIKLDKKFDMVFSCEVLQRLKNRKGYIKELCNNSNAVALFTPNKGNMAHATTSGLGSLELSELLDENYPNKEIIDSGYLDFPPWPPGIKRSEEKREKTEHGFLEKQFMVFCQLWVKIERFIPFRYRYRYSHIVYVLLK